MRIFDLPTVITAIGWKTEDLNAICMQAYKNKGLQEHCMSLHGHPAKVTILQPHEFKANRALISCARTMGEIVVMQCDDLHQIFPGNDTYILVRLGSDILILNRETCKWDLDSVEC